MALDGDKLVYAGNASTVSAATFKPMKRGYRVTWTARVLSHKGNRPVAFTYPERVTELVCYTAEDAAATVRAINDRDVAVHEIHNIEPIDSDDLGLASLEVEGTIGGEK